MNKFYGRGGVAIYEYNIIMGAHRKSLRVEKKNSQNVK